MCFHKISWVVWLPSAVMLVLLATIYCGLARDFALPTEVIVVVGVSGDINFL